MATQVGQRFADVFKHVRFAVIGMIHVPALPGTPRYPGSDTSSVNSIIEKCCEEAEVYKSCGVGGVLVENMHDIPYVRTSDMGPEITAVMTRVCSEVRKVLPASIPCGVQVLAGANKEALAVALAADLQFIRAEGFVFGHVGDEGFMDACAGPLLRYRRVIGADHVAVFTDIKKKHSSHAITADVSIEETAHAAEFFLSDGVVITGSATGQPADFAQVRGVKEKSSLPVLVGSGVDDDNIGKFAQCADGAIIGSHFKHGGRSYDRIPWYYMDVWELLEVTCLGVDAALLVPCIVMLYQKRNFKRCIQEAVKVGNDSDETSQARVEIPYAVISGQVRCSTGKPLESSTTPGVSGVIRRVSLAERYVSGSMRTWMECERFLSSSLECTNFVMRTTRGSDVAVERPLAAARLSLEALSDRYEPHRPAFVEILWEIAAMFRFIPGGRQQGLLLREEMLREGTNLTAIGALQSEGNRLKILPPQGKPYVLSAHSFEEIHTQVEREVLFYKVVVTVASIVGITLACHLGWRRFRLMNNSSRLQMDIYEICVKTTPTS